MLYDWIKALHVIAVISWMAGLLYLPRLFVYHCQVEPGSAQSETFKVMQDRLLRFIMRPALAASWIFGVTMLFLHPDWLNQGWLHAKLALVIGLSGLHHAMIVWHRAFMENRNQRSVRFFRLINEGPTVLMVGIVILVIVKPF